MPDGQPSNYRLYPPGLLLATTQISADLPTFSRFFRHCRLFASCNVYFPIVTFKARPQFIPLSLAISIAFSSLYSFSSCDWFRKNLLSHWLHNEYFLPLTTRVEEDFFLHKKHFFTLFIAYILPIPYFTNTVYHKSLATVEHAEDPTQNIILLVIYPSLYY